MTQEQESILNPNFSEHSLEVLGDKFTEYVKELVYEDDETETVPSELKDLHSELYGAIGKKAAIPLALTILIAGRKIEKDVKEGVSYEDALKKIADTISKFEDQNLPRTQEIEWEEGGPKTMQCIKFIQANKYPEVYQNISQIGPEKVLAYMDTVSGKEIKNPVKNGVTKKTFFIDEEGSMYLNRRTFDTLLKSYTSALKEDE